MLIGSDSGRGCDSGRDVGTWVRQWKGRWVRQR